MTRAERKAAEVAGEAAGQAFNILHYAIVFGASGANFDARRTAALKKVREAERALIAFQRKRRAA